MPLFLIISGLAVALVDFFFVIRSWHYLTRRRCLAPDVQGNQALVMILAVFEEVDTIENTISFLESRELRDVTQVLIVGNARERDSEGKNPTLELARNSVSRSDFIKILECDTAEAIKAHQVNFAARKIETEPSQTWLYVMDVDTRFTHRNVEMLRQAMALKHKIIQQHTHFLEGYKGNSVIGRSFAAHQTRWTLAHEMTRIWLYNRFRIGVYHLVGHGMCINADIFEKLGGFSETVKIEDIHFGYMCCMRGYTVHSAPLLEGSDTPSQLSSLWQQQYGWSLGAFQVVLYWKLLIDSGFKPSYYNYIQNIYCVWNYSRWLCQSAFMWLMLCFLLAGIHSLTVLAFFLVYVLSFVASGLAMKQAGILNGSLVEYVVLGFLNSFFRSFPVMHCFFDQVFGVERSKYKTKHRKL